MQFSFTLDKKYKKLKYNFGELRKLMQYLVAAKGDRVFDYVAPPNVYFRNPRLTNQVFIFNIPSFNYDCYRHFCNRLTLNINKYCPNSQNNPNQSSRVDLRKQCREIHILKHPFLKNDFYKKDEYLANVKKFCHDYFYMENICETASKENKDKYLQVMQHNLEMFRSNYQLYHSYFSEYTVTPCDLIANSYPIRFEHLTNLRAEDWIQLGDWALGPSDELSTTKIGNKNTTHKSLDKVSRSKNFFEKHLAKYNEFRMFTKKQRKYSLSFGLDCEMVICMHEGEEIYAIGRVTLVDIAGKICCDEYVVPKYPVKDYNTKYSGITSAHFADCPNTLDSIYTRLDSIVDPDDFIIGHGLDNDFKCLHIVHLNNIDTSILYRNFRGNQYKPKLKLLTKIILLKHIQTEYEEKDLSTNTKPKDNTNNNGMEDVTANNVRDTLGSGVSPTTTMGHDSIEDAKCALDLCLLYLMQVLKVFSYEDSYNKYIVNMQHIFSAFKWAEYEVNMVFEKHEQAVGDACLHFIEQNKLHQGENDVHLCYLDWLARWHEIRKHENTKDISFNAIGYVDSYYVYRNAFLAKLALWVNTLGQQFPSSLFIMKSTYYDKKMKQVIEDKYDCLKLVQNEDFKYFYDNYGKYEFIILNS